MHWKLQRCRICGCGVWSVIMFGLNPKGDADYHVQDGVIGMIVVSTPGWTVSLVRGDSFRNVELWNHRRREKWRERSIIQRHSTGMDNSHGRHRVLGDPPELLTAEQRMDRRKVLSPTRNDTNLRRYYLLVGH